MSFFGNRRQVEPATPTPPTPQRQEPAQPLALTQPSVGFETVVGANCTLEGSLKSISNVRLDGTFTGTLEITGNVLVGETAKINAHINGRNISIAGAVRGNVSGRKVQILRTGRVWGDISAQALTTEEGAFIDGKITMMGHEANKPVPTSTSSEENTTPPETELSPEERIIEALQPVGMGATEDDADEMIHEGEGDGPARVENISAGEDLPVGGDSPEGQSQVDDDPTEDRNAEDENETKQST